MKKAFFANLFLALFLSWAFLPQPAFSAAKEDATDVAEDPMHDIATAIYESTNQKIMDGQSQRGIFNSAFADQMKAIKTYFINEYVQRIAPYAEQMPFAAEYLQLVNERVFSEFNAAQVKIAMDKINLESLSGYQNVENVGLGSTDNPMSQPTPIASNAKIAAKLNTIFCNPKSKLATEDCKESGTAGPEARQNFIDFFISERTWPTATVLDVMQISRAFISTALPYVDLTKDEASASKFMGNQNALAHDNLRLSILDDLAARRAATSHATTEALMTLLKILAPSGQITSLDYQKICSKTTQTAIERYVCSFTSAPVSGQQRIISQAALDKITQFDLMLSPNLYEEINSPMYTATGPIEKLEVYLKAQQVAQDYRQLRLLQMKVAARAMNMMKQ